MVKEGHSQWSRKDKTFASSNSEETFHLTFIKSEQVDISNSYTFPTCQSQSDCTEITNKSFAKKGKKGAFVL